MTYRSPLLDLPGAVEADPPDAGVAAHYGDPFAEQRRLAAGAGVVDLSHRPVLRVAGPDRLAWLHSLTTQHLEHLEPGRGTTALLLSPHGHVEHELPLVDDGSAVWTHVEPGSARPLLEFLEKMRFWAKVELADVSADWAVVWQPGQQPHPTYLTRTDPPSPYGGVPGRETFLPRAALADAVAAGPPAGVWAYEALRVAAARPRAGRETDHRTIPHEVDWLRDAVHLHKGCYRGQETIARVHNLGRPPRRLVLLHLDGSVERLPVHGDAVELDGRAIGFVTTAARHYELGPIALALVKRTTPAEATLLAGGVAASQELVVPA